MSCRCGNFPLVVKLHLDVCFPPLQWRSWASEERRLRAEPARLRDGCRYRGAPCRPSGADGRGSPVPLCLPQGTILSHAKCAAPCSCSIVFTSDFFTCFPDLPEALNLPDASLPSTCKMGCGKFFVLFFFFFCYSKIN